MSLTRSVLLFGLLVVLVAPLLADGPETGTITGTVSDAAGGPLPGVQVTLTGERGSEVVFTGEDGAFRFGLVPPGSYVVSAQLEGFATVEQAVTVTVGSRTNLDWTLAMATEEQITVTSEAPMVDKYNVTAGAVMQAETAGQIGATVRSFYGAVQALPGVTNDAESMDLSQSRPTVNGALWQESNVYIDGVDATYSMRGGATRVFLPSIALTEVNMEAGGGGAEYGRNVGSHTNLIVRSGTNRFHGQATGVYSDQSWNENYEPQPELANDERFVNTFLDKGFTPEEAREQVVNWVVYQPGEREGSDTNLEATLGGPIQRDKAWFFVARGEVSTNQLDKTLDGQLFNNSSELFSNIVKLNGQPGKSHSLAYTFIESPVDRIFLLPPMGDRYVATFFDLSGDVNSLSWNWSATQSLFLEAKIARQVSDENRRYPFPPEVKFEDPAYAPNPALGPFSPNNNDESYVQNFDNTWHNGWIFERGFGLNEFPREQANVAATQFVTNHELKYGIDLQQVEWNQHVSRPDIFSGFDFELGTPFGYANGCNGVAQDPTEAGRDTRCFWVDYNGHGLERGSADSDGANYAAYARDRFSIGDHWTMNVGLRFEQQTLENDRGREVIDSSTFSPRLNVVYDLGGDGRRLVTFNAGRFFVQTPQDLVNSNLQEDWNGASNAYDLLQWGGNLVDPALDVLTNCFILDVFTALPIELARTPYCLSLGAVRPGQMWQMVDSGLFGVDIEPYHRDELVLGYEWQLTDNWAFDAKGIWWQVDNLIGATLQRDENFDLFQLVENYEDYPDILRSLGFVDNVVAAGLMTREQAETVLADFEDDHRRYRALQLQLNRRFANGWAVFNNLTFSEVQGKTYGGGNGDNDLGAFSNLNSDYGRNMELIFTEDMIDLVDCEGNLAEAGLPAGNCREVLLGQVGRPLSTINRWGDMPIDRPIIFKSYGYRQWELGDHTLNLGGLFVFQSGAPWQKTRSFSLPACINTGGVQPCLDLEDIALNTGVNTYVTPRGTFDNPDFWWLNLTGAWSFPIAGRVTGQLRAEITNVTDEQDKVTTSDRTGAPLRSRRSFLQPRKYRLVGSVRF